jgi:hypothetical protein
MIVGTRWFCGCWVKFDTGVIVSKINTSRLCNKGTKSEKCSSKLLFTYSPSDMPVWVLLFPWWLTLSVVSMLLVCVAFLSRRR